MLKSLGYQLYACGNRPLPPQIVFAGNTYRLREVLKHDFFAATALYQAKSPKNSAPEKIVLKLSRQQYFLGLPLEWLGEIICSHEISILRRLSHLGGTPRFLSRYGKVGMLYRYIEGESLDDRKDLPDDFFDELEQLIKKIHTEEIAYLDMNKKGNILLGSDGRPYLIDFQISLHIHKRFLLFPRLSLHLRKILRQADRYHLLKHKRRYRPDSMTPRQKALSYEKSAAIRIHRFLTGPARKLRRVFLGYLYKNGYLHTRIDGRRNSEDDPAKYLR